MKHLFVFIFLYAFSIAHENNSKPRLPVSLRFEQVDAPMQQLFRENFSARKIDTIGWRDGLSRIQEAMQNKLAESMQNGTFKARMMNDLEPTQNIVYIKVVNPDQPLEKIGWKAYAFPGRNGDTTLRYYTIPDSLRGNAPKAIDACVELILKSKNLR